MIDSRNSSARGKRSHIAGIDTSSFGYRPATEGTFFLPPNNIRCWLAGDPFNFDPIVFPLLAYFSPRSRAVVELAEPLRPAGSSSVGIHASSVRFKERKNYQRLRPPPPPPLRSLPNPERLS